MAIEVVCSGCKTRFRARDSDAGKRGKCPRCGTVIVVPDVAYIEPEVLAEPQRF